MVIATCDAYHAMTSNRSYRQAMPQRAAIRELEANAGTQFDAGVVAALIAEVA
jgi:HD-GYP domain-containing protein (c-di-GMP phosphodiesterase class II)